VGELGDLAVVTGVDLGAHEMFQPVIIGRSNKDLGIHGLAGDPVNHEFVSVLFIATLFQLVFQYIHNVGTVRGKCCGVPELAHCHRRLGTDAFHQLIDGHPARDTEWIDDGRSHRA